MPNINVTWSEQFTSTREQQPVDTWIRNLIWNNNTFSTLPQGGGLYIIENPAGVCIYAGKATNTRTRFATRSEPLREFRLITTANPLNPYRVRLADVNPYEEGAGNSLDVAETWLIRFITRYQTLNGPMRLQNINKIDPWTPTAATTISQSPSNRPS